MGKPLTTNRIAIRQVDVGDASVLHDYFEQRAWLASIYGRNSLLTAPELGIGTRMKSLVAGFGTTW